MIQQLILNTLLACTSTESDPLIEEVDTPIKELPKQTVFFVENLSDLTSTPNSKPVRLSHIPYPRSSFNDELFCTYICNYANQGRGQNIQKVEDCRVDLVSNWEEQRKGLTWEEIADKGDVAVGQVECVGHFQPESMIMRGRAALSSTRFSDVSDDLGGYFAKAAQEEMTAVFAFQEMLQNLKSFNAPQKLLDDCEKAICDEKRHTIMMSNMAKRHGCESAMVKLPKQQKVSLFELAKHNAIAGCIEETWAALAAEHQSKHTKHYIKLFEVIAKDEIFHAQLSWDIHQWLMTKLSKDEQIIIDDLMLKQLQKIPSQKKQEVDLGQITSLNLQTIWNYFTSQITSQIEKLSA